MEVGVESRHWADMINNPRRPVAHWHHLQPIPGQSSHTGINTFTKYYLPITAEKNRFEKIFPKRVNLTKAISVDANEAKEAILSLKRTKSTQEDCYASLT